MADRADYDEFVAARSRHLLRIAFILTRNVASAEDLVQDALVKAWFAWPRIESNPEAYVRRVLFRTFISNLRRRSTQETTVEVLPEDGQLTTDVAVSVATRLALWEALGRLPRKQRALVVLRYFEDLTEVQTADLLGVSVGTVKSQTSRALARLRIDPTLVDRSPDAAPNSIKHKERPHAHGA